MKNPIQYSNYSGRRKVAKAQSEKMNKKPFLNFRNPLRLSSHQYSILKKRGLQCII